MQAGSFRRRDLDWCDSLPTSPSSSRISPSSRALARRPLAEPQPDRRCSVRVAPHWLRDRPGSPGGGFFLCVVIKLRHGLYVRTRGLLYSLGLATYRPNATEV